MIGESAFTPSITGDALRYMDVPSRDRRNPTSEMYSRDHVSNMYRGEQDRGGVHINSGVPNNVFYLLANGGANPTSGQRVAQGIGMEKALRIYYRANTVYFTPNTTFAQARAGWERAAGDLYGRDSAELRTVRAAASAVGIEAQSVTAGLVS
jgi:Zn-dependent metalloprotease